MVDFLYLIPPNKDNLDWYHIYGEKKMKNWTNNNDFPKTHRKKKMGEKNK
jgi:hypothetical protein